MPELRNIKHERFAQERSRGASATAAYIAAGGAKNGAGQSAYRLSKRADVQARIAEIQREREHINAASTELAIERVAISKESLILELAKIGFADFDPKKAKVSDKQQALMNIAKLFGWVSTKEVLEKLSNEELMAIIREGQEMVKEYDRQQAEKQEKPPKPGKPKLVA